MAVYEKFRPSILNMSCDSPIFLKPDRSYKPYGVSITGKDLQINPIEWRGCLGPLQSVLNQSPAEADLAVAPIDAHAKQATMLGKPLGMRSQVDVPDNLAA